MKIKCLIKIGAILVMQSAPLAVFAVPITTHHGFTSAKSLSVNRGLYSPSQRATVAGRRFELVWALGDRSATAGESSTELQVLEVNPLTKMPLDNAWRATVSGATGDSILTGSITAIENSGIIVASESFGRGTFCNVMRLTLAGEVVWQTRLDDVLCSVIAASGNRFWRFSNGRYALVDGSNGQVMGKETDAESWNYAYPVAGGFFWASAELSKVGLVNANGEMVWEISSSSPNRLVDATFDPVNEQLWTIEQIPQPGSSFLASVQSFDTTGQTSQTLDNGFGYIGGFTARAERVAWFRNNDSYQIVSRLESGALARHSITPSSLAPGFLPSIAIEADRKIVFGVVGSQTTEVFRWDPGAGAPIAVRSVPGTFGLIDELNEFGRVILMHQPQILSIDAAEPVTWNETRVGGHPRSTFLQDGRGIVAYPRAVVSFNADGQQRAAFHNTEAPWRTRAPVDDSGAIVSGGNFVKRLGANGETLWSKTYTDSLSSVDVSENGFSIVATFQDQFTYNPNGVQISRVQPFSSMKFVFGNSIVSGYQGGSGFVARSRFPTGGWSVSPLAFTKPAWHKLTDAIWVSARRNSMSFIHDLSRIDAIGVLANYGMQLSEQPSDLSVCPNGDVLAATQNQLHRFVVLGNSHRQLVSAQPRIISVRCTNNNIAVIFSAFNDNKYDLRVQTVSEEGRVLSTQDLYSGVVADTFPASPITTYALPNGDLRWMREAFIPPQSQGAVDTVIYASEILSSKGFE